MGLDMYLYKKTYVGNEYREPKHRLTVTVPADQGSALYPQAADLIEDEKISEITEKAAYWRKANSIHKWFVDSLQDGEDDCRNTYVPMESLQELYDLCKKVLAEAKTSKPIPSDITDWSEWDGLTVENPERLMDLLPTAEGFFFGNTQIGGDYLYDIANTIEQIGPYLEKDSEGKYKYNVATFEYHSSW